MSQSQCPKDSRNSGLPDPEIAVPAGVGPPRSAASSRHPAGRGAVGSGSGAPAPGGPAWSCATHAAAQMARPAHPMSYQMEQSNNTLSKLSFQNVSEQIVHNLTCSTRDFQRAFVTSATQSVEKYEIMITKHDYFHYDYSYLCVCRIMSVVDSSQTRSLPWIHSLNPVSLDGIRVVREVNNAREIRGINARKLFQLKNV